MPHPIAQQHLENALDQATAAGIVLSWSMHRGRRNTMVRRFVVNTADGNTHVWTPHAVDVFGYALELMELVANGNSADPE